MANVNHFKIELGVCFVSLDSAGGYLLSDIEEYAGKGNVVKAQVWRGTVCGE